MTDTELEPLDDNTPPADPPADAPGTDIQADGDAPPGDTPPDPDPSGYTKAINRKHFEMEEQRRRADAAETELQTLRNAQQPSRPEIPAIPDPYDENFTDLLETRDKAINEAAQFDANQAQQQAAQQREAYAAQHQQRTELNESIQTYAGRAEKLGVSAAELEVAGNTVAAYGLPDVLAQHILADEQGPLITSYLAKNPNELEALRKLPLMQAGVHISTVIRDKVKAGQGISNTPEPVDGLGGGGAPPGKRGPAGAKFE